MAVVVTVVAVVAVAVVVAVAGRIIINTARGQRIGKGVVSRLIYYRRGRRGPVRRVPVTD